MSKIVLITGGSRGIGAACARLLAAEGYEVAVNYASNSEAAADVVASILNAGGQAMMTDASICRFGVIGSFSGQSRHQRPDCGRGNVPDG